MSSIIGCDVSEMYTYHTYIYTILDKGCPQYVARNITASDFIYSLDGVRCVTDQKCLSNFFNEEFTPPKGEHAHVQNQLQLVSLSRYLITFTVDSSTNSIDSNTVLQIASPGLSMSRSM